MRKARLQPDRVGAVSSIDESIGLRLRDMRRRRRLSLEELGQEIGVSYQQMQKYERGANRVSASTLWRLARALNVSISQFFVGLPGILEAPERAPTERIADPELRKRFDALIQAIARAEAEEAQLVESGNCSLSVLDEPTAEQSRSLPL